MILSSSLLAMTSFSMSKWLGVSTVLVSVPVLLVHGAKFRNVGDLLRVACTSEPSSSGSRFRWMILLSSVMHFPPAIVDALKEMECDYEIRSIESLPRWNTSDQLPHVDYKVIAIGLSMTDLRKGLNIYVSVIGR